MTKEEMVCLRKSIKREIIRECENNNIKFNEKLESINRRIDSLNNHILEIHKGLNILTEKLIYLALNENKKEKNDRHY